MVKILTWVMAIVLLFSRCGKNEDVGIVAPVPTSLEAKAKALRVTFQKMQQEEQQNMYRTLTPEEKQALWQDKLDQTLKFNWNEEQRQHLLLMKNIVQAKSFQERKSEERDLDYNNAIDSWKKKGFQLFNHETLKQIVTTLYDYNTETYSFKSGARVAGNCTCSRYDDWCFQSSCIGACTDYTYTGCGTLWRESCGGDCRSSQST